MSNFKEITAFVSVASRGSLSAAARAEGVTPAMMGRRIDALEERLRRNRREFDKRLGLHDKKDDPQRLYRDFEREQARIRDEQRSILNALQWNQYQSRNAAALLEQLR